MPKPRFALAAILLLYAVMAAVGITWGLPTARIDKFLFGGDPPWPGEKIARLAKASQKGSATRGADVDVNPLDLTTNGPINLTATEEDVAAIYLRYRLYTHQPDEMITMMALAGMKPRQLQLDPRLYQYGGLFIYPVGAAIGTCGALGLVHVTSDLTYYLDHPDEFGKFYVIARVYVALWGALGVVLVYAIASRLSRTGFQPVTPHSALRTPHLPGLLAALFFAVMPITVCMSHEAKPHLPGAVLMLAAVYFSMKYTNSEFRIQNSKKIGRDWLLMCISCGAAFGMVLSALPIFILIPLTEFLRRGRGRKSEISNLKSQIAPPPPSPITPRSSLSFRTPHSLARPRAVPWQAALRTLLGLTLALAVYLATNPYVAINTVANREVLLSNLRTSTAMYEVGLAGEGLMRAIELTAEGTSLPLLALGVIGMAPMLRCAKPNALLLVVPAAIVFIQFVLLGAGKPAEYGRFGIFIDASLVVAAAGLMARLMAALRRVGVIIVALALLAVAFCGWRYLYNFHKDAGPDNTREQLAAMLAEPHSALRTPHTALCLLSDPAPYNCPPMDFSRTTLLRYPSRDSYLADPRGPLLITVDGNPTEMFLQRRLQLRGSYTPPPFSPISWANKPLVLGVPSN